MHKRAARGHSTIRGVWRQIAVIPQTYETVISNIPTGKAVKILTLHWAISWEKAPELFPGVPCCYRGVMDAQASVVPSQAIRSVDTYGAVWLSVPVQLSIYNTVLDRKAELSPLLHLYLCSQNVTKNRIKPWERQDWSQHHPHACWRLDLLLLAVDPSSSRGLNVFK